MLLGLNTPFFLQSNQDQPGITTNYTQKLIDLGVTHLRIPLNWSALHNTRTDHLNQPILDRYREFFSALPSDVKLLGFITNAPSEIARDFFYYGDALPAAAKSFFRMISQSMPEITEWEVWNEPNASDFYLSRGCKSGHRPWTPNEFCEELLVPLATEIRALRPNDLICAAAVAEDGIVGHRSKSPALSNRCPRDDEFKELRSFGQHDHYYFIPDFTQTYLKCLGISQREHKDETGAALFDACGCHPYPYFAIRHNPSNSLADRTTSHVQRFVEIADSTLPHGIEIWLTEYGARSLVIPQSHYSDEEQQDDYFWKVWGNQYINRRVHRLYWYKFLDRMWDLQQEKTFGICDYFGNARMVYYSCQQVLLGDYNGAKRIHDDMTYRPHGSSFHVNPAFWQLRQSSDFAYTVPTTDEVGNTGLLFYSGRNPGDQITLYQKGSMLNETGVRLQLTGEILGRASTDSICVSIKSNSNNDRQITVWFRKENADYWGIFEDGHDTSVTRVRTPSETSNDRQKFVIHCHVTAGTCFCKLSFGEYHYVTTFPFEGSFGEKELSWSISMSRGNNRSSIIKIDDILIESTEPTKWTQEPFRTHILGPARYMFHGPSFSQIGQDLWALKASGLKRGGYFVEIGGHDPHANSNSFILERDWGWLGTIIEANPKFIQTLRGARIANIINCAIFEEDGQELKFVDAGAVGGIIGHTQEDKHSPQRARREKEGHVINVRGRTADSVFKEHEIPVKIDFLSVDTEGSELQVLNSIDFERVEIALVTVEHGGNEEKSRAVSSLMERHGFLRTKVWFEDWFVNPHALARVADLAGQEDVKEHLSDVWQSEPIIVGNELLTEARKRWAEGEHHTSLVFYREVCKAAFLNRGPRLAEYIRALRTVNLSEKAVKVAQTAVEEVDSHPGAMEQAIITFSENSRFVLLERAILLAEKRVAPILSNSNVLASIKNAIRVDSDKLPNSHREALARIAHRFGDPDGGADSCST